MTHDPTGHGTNEPELARLFEEHRPRMRAIAHRMLGSANDADDVVQEAWLRLQRVAGTGATGDADNGESAGAGPSGAQPVGAADDARSADAGPSSGRLAGIDNLGGWLTVVVSRLCLDQLRSRGSRPESSVDEVPELTRFSAAPDATPEDLTLQSDAVGAALVVVLDTLGPTERLAFVLHDLFGLPFDEIAPIVGKSSAATRQLASRARRRIRGTEPTGGSDRRREVVEAFLAASREGDFGRLLQVLDPEVELRADPATVAGAAANAHRGAPLLGEVVSGADAVARVFAGRAQGASVALVDGVPAAVWAPGGKPRTVFVLEFSRDRITGVEVIADPDELAELDIILDPA